MTEFIIFSFVLYIVFIVVANYLDFETDIVMALGFIPTFLLVISILILIGMLLEYLLENKIITN